MAAIMNSELVAELMGMIPDRGDFPVQVPLFTGGSGYDPVNLVLAFQKKDGIIVVFYVDWDSSWVTLHNGYRMEEFPTLVDLFKKYPGYLDIIHKPPLEQEVPVVEPKPEKLEIGIIPWFWRTICRM